MNKNVMIGLSGLGLAALIGIAFFVFNPSGQPQTEDLQQNEKPSAVQNITGTLKDLLARNVPMECNYSQAFEGMMTTGTIYVDGRRMRGNFQTAQEDQETVDSFMIQDGEYAYMWSSQQAKGTKLKNEDQQEREESDGVLESEQEPSSPLKEEDVDYSCQPWAVDDSFFTPPGDIEFIDLSQQVNQVPENVCDQLPDGESKTACEQSLGL